MFIHFAISLIAIIIGAVYSGIYNELDALMISLIFAGFYNVWIELRKQRPAIQILEMIEKENQLLNNCRKLSLQGNPIFHAEARRSINDLIEKTNKMAAGYIDGSFADFKKMIESFFSKTPAATVYTTNYKSSLLWEKESFRNFYMPLNERLLEMGGKIIRIFIFDSKEEYNGMQSILEEIAQKLKRYPESKLKVIKGLHHVFFGTGAAEKQTNVIFKYKEGQFNCLANLQSSEGEKDNPWGWRLKMWVDSKKIIETQNEFNDIEDYASDYIENMPWDKF